MQPATDRSGSLGLTYLPVTVGNIIAMTFVSCNLHVLPVQGHSEPLGSVPLCVPTLLRTEGAATRPGTDPARREARHGGLGGTAICYHFLLVWVGTNSCRSILHPSSRSIIRWTSFPQISFWVPLMSGVLMGMSTLALLVRHQRAWDSLTEGKRFPGLPSQLHYR